MLTLQDFKKLHLNLKKGTFQKVIYLKKDNIFPDAVVLSLMAIAYMMTHVGGHIQQPSTQKQTEYKINIVSNNF